MLAGGRKDPQPSRARDVHIPQPIDLDAVYRVLAWCGRHVEEDAAPRQRSIGAHVVPHHDLLLLIPIPDVEVLLVWRERQAVGPTQNGAEQLQLAVGEPEYARERQLPAWIVGELWQAERGIGEVKRTIGLVNEVVRAVQASAVEPVRQNRQRARLLETGDAAIAMLVDRQPAFAVERETIRPRLSIFADVEAGVPALGPEHRESVILRPAVNRVRVRIAEQEITLRHPYRTFSEQEPFCQSL